MIGESSSNKLFPMSEAVSFLTEDLIIEIICRLPYSSLCRFKCVSKSWLALCSDPKIRKKSSQTLSGFFYARRSCRRANHFTNLVGRGRPMVDPSLPFLPTRGEVTILDCCNGLLLCNYISWPSRGRQFKRHYLVCNPATHKWAMLPNTEHMQEMHLTRLGFDPSVSSHFTVFMVTYRGYGVNDQVTGIEIYSSVTRVWTYRESEWGDDTRIRQLPAKCVFSGGVTRFPAKSVFFDGIMHFTTSGSSLVTVDKEGKIWRKIPTPHQTLHTFIGVSQGFLCSVHHDWDAHEIAVRVLEDYSSGQWILKHTFSTYQLPEPLLLQFQTCNIVIAVHPEQNLIYLRMGNPIRIISINMDSRTVHAIRTLGYNARDPFLPYIPCFSEWLIDGQ